MEGKEKIDFFCALVQMLNDTENVEILGMAIKMSKFKDNLVTASDTTVTIEIPKVVEMVTEVVPYNPFPWNPMITQPYYQPDFFHVTCNGNENINNKTE